MAQQLNIRNQETVEAINEIARIEERRPHDVAERLFKKVSIRRLAKLRKEKVKP